MTIPPPGDQGLRALVGATLRAERDSDVTYELTGVLGEGAESVAFSAQRRSPQGVALVAVKVIHPHVMRAAEPTGLLMVRKEAVALGRLNEGTPPTPFVVRFVDVGSVEVTLSGAALELPWIALEHVDGGPEGATLQQRVEHSVRVTGFAFDPRRAALAIRSMGGGLEAIRQAGVVHRDINARNVLCCGFGADEVFKIADFGLARPEGMQGSFLGLPLGTAGYVAPEVIEGQTDRVGHATDVFAFAAVIYRMLTGREYFATHNLINGLTLARAAHRARVTDEGALCPEIRESGDACEQIDLALRIATDPDPARRTPLAETLATTVAGALDSVTRGRRAARRYVSTMTGRNAPTLLSGWTWTVRHAPGGREVIKSVAWSGDGRCVALTDRGVRLWNGTAWSASDPVGLPPAEGLKFVHHRGQGRWVMGGDGDTLAFLEAGKGLRVVRGPDPGVTFMAATGDATLVFAVHRPGDTWSVCSLAGDAWLSSSEIPDTASINAISLLDERRFLAVGRSRAGAAFATTYEAEAGRIGHLPAGAARALTACCARPEVPLALAVGTGGHALRLDGSTALHMSVGEDADLSAVAADLGGNAWAAGAGRLWLQQPEHVDRWVRVWHEPSWTAPFVGLHADLGVVVAVTADGGVVEGRALMGARR